MRECGECSMCCKLLGVEELEKPKNKWCSHCKISEGCAIYESRPPSCRNFKCLWIINDKMPEELRPDRAKVVFYEPQEDISPGVTADLMMLEDPQMSGRWKTGIVARTIADFRKQGLKLCIVTKDKHVLDTG